MSLRAYVEKAWYGQPGWLYLLSPLEWLFRVVVGYRRRKYRHDQRGDSQDRDGAAVIVVGNIAVGGSGKTPLVLALTEQLSQRGYQVGIVSRGYGGRSEHYPLLVTADTDPSLCGDEPLLLATRSGRPLAVAPDRPAAAALLAAQGCDLIISDDGLQHYRLARTLEVLVIDGQRGMGNGHCLPVGPLREPPSRITEVDFCVINGAATAVAVPGSYLMTLSGQSVYSLVGEQRVELAQWSAVNRRVHAVAGIGHPQRFFDSLRALGFDPVDHPFADHHTFSDQDFVFDEELPILMTEKDAVKCRDLGLKNAWYLPVTAELDAEFFDSLCQSLEQKRR